MSDFEVKLFKSKSYYKGTVDSYYKKKPENWQLRPLVVQQSTDKFTKIEIFQRDHWLCQICYKKINNKMSFPHPDSATLDHIIPICKGGKHTKDNVQCAHWKCNKKKSTATE